MWWGVEGVRGGEASAGGGGGCGRDRPCLLVAGCWLEMVWLGPLEV